MNKHYLYIVALFLAVRAFSGAAMAQESGRDNVKSADTPRPDYVLGPGDQIVLWAVDLDDVSQKPVRVDAAGYVTLPLAGRVEASGRTVAEVQQDIVAKLQKYQRNPQVTVSVTEYHSQSVSVIGAVNNPGVHSLQGKSTLIETLSLAGGLRADAGYSIKITRRREAGPIPLPTAKEDPSGNFTVAEVNVADLTDARSPESNILVQSQDVISVPKAQMVYVMGEVSKPGAFTLGEKSDTSVLQALSEAGGMTRLASAKNARILRRMPGEKTERTEQIIDLNAVLSSKTPDVILHPEDILYVPDNKPKSVALRAIEAAVSTGTGIAVWRGSR
jgi:polysaccharide export outer membrane protein